MSPERVRKALTDLARSPRVYAGMAAGLVAGLLTALGARVAMRVVRVYTEGGSGEFTLQGTLGILFFLSLPAVAAGALYVALAQRLPGRALVKGLAYGLILLSTLGTLFFLSADEEFGEFVPGRALRAVMFGALFLVYGAVTGLVAGRLEHRRAPPGLAFALLGVGALTGAGLIALGLVFFAVQLAERPDDLPGHLLVWAGSLGLASLLLAVPSLRKRGEVEKPMRAADRRLD